MFHYLFTNDLRISNLESFLTEAGKCFVEDTVPSAAEDKNANNNMNTLGFYFNLTKDSNCAKACKNGDVRKVVLNFMTDLVYSAYAIFKSIGISIENILFDLI